jgi:hypothetical protein
MLPHSFDALILTAPSEVQPPGLVDILYGSALAPAIT